MIKIIKLAQYSPTAKVATIAVIANISTPYLPDFKVCIISTNIDRAIIEPVITFTDTIRPEAKKTMEELRKLNVNHLLMVTGDHQTVADTIANEVGITEVYAECLPQDKIDVLKKIPASNRPVIMVGDGVNDAPSLAIADVGIAMGAHGATAASETAEAVILKDDLEKVSTAVKISKDTMKIAKQSVLIGILICTILMLIASTGIIPALFGAVLQEVVDTVSILSSLRANEESVCG